MENKQVRLTGILIGASNYRGHQCQKSFSIILKKPGKISLEELTLYFPSKRNKLSDIGRQLNEQYRNFCELCPRCEKNKVVPQGKRKERTAHHYFCNHRANTHVYLSPESVSRIEGVIDAY